MLPVQEFGAWFQWLLYDALFTLILNIIVKRVESLRPLFELVGWL